MRKGVKYPKAGRDITNKKFGMIKVISFAYIKHKRTYWNCICECGKEIIKSKKYLRECPRVASCGCAPRISRGRQIRTFEEAIAYKMICIKNSSHWEGDCLIWDGVLQSDGYAKTNFLGTCFYVKDLLYFFKIRTIFGENQIINLTCNNRRCVNINHMEKIHYGYQNRPINRLFEIQENRRKQTDFNKPSEIAVRIDTSKEPVTFTTNNS